MSHSKILIRISRINPEDIDLDVPEYATPGSSGMDLRSATDGIIHAGETALIPTGFRIEIPEGYEGQIRPRSGLALKSSVGIPNAPGTIDSDYRGELKVILINFGKQDFAFTRGDRIAQLVIAPVVRGEWVEVGEIAETSRGSGGFGHTGK